METDGQMVHGLALHMGEQKLSYNLDMARHEQRSDIITLNMPCTRCGHLNPREIDKEALPWDNVNRSVKLRARCDACGQEVQVNISKRDNEMSI